MFEVSFATTGSLRTTRVAYYPQGFEVAVNEDFVEGITDLVLEVRAGRSTRSWTAVIAGGSYGTPPAIAREVAVLPDGECFLAVCDGAGYVIRASDPNDWSETAAFPITQIVTCKSPPLVIVADFTTLTAFGLTGVVWVSEQLAADGLSVVSVEPDHIVARGYDPSRGQHEAFRVSVETGARHTYG
jgi:hypothetical protein